MWDALEVVLGDLELPEIEKEFSLLLMQGYKYLTKQDLSNRTPVYVEDFARGGMSSGKVCPRFWKKTGFKLLMKRFSQAKEPFDGFDHMTYHIVIKDGETIPDGFDDNVELYNVQGERIYLPPGEPRPKF